MKTGNFESRVREIEEGLQIEFERSCFEATHHPRAQRKHLDALIYSNSQKRKTLKALQNKLIHTLPNKLPTQLPESHSISKLEQSLVETQENSEREERITSELVKKKTFLTQETLEKKARIAELQTLLKKLDEKRITVHQTRAQASGQMHLLTHTLHQNHECIAKDRSLRVKKLASALSYEKKLKSSVQELTKQLAVHIAEKENKITKQSGTESQLKNSIIECEKIRLDSKECRHIIQLYKTVFEHLIGFESPQASDSIIEAHKQLIFQESSLQAQFNSLVKSQQELKEKLESETKELQFLKNQKSLPMEEPAADTKTLKITQELSGLLVHRLSDFSKTILTNLECVTSYCHTHSETINQIQIDLEHALKLEPGLRINLQNDSLLNNTKTVTTFVANLVQLLVKIFRSLERETPDSGTDEFLSSPSIDYTKYAQSHQQNLSKRSQNRENIRHQHSHGKVYRNKLKKITVLSPSLESGSTVLPQLASGKFLLRDIKNFQNSINYLSPQSRKPKPLLKHYFSPKSTRVGR